MIPKIKAILRFDKKKKKSNLVPIYVRIRVNGEEQYKSTSHWIEDGKGYWDKNDQSVTKKHHDHENINKAIIGLKTKLQNEATMQMVNGNGDAAMTTNSIIAKAMSSDGNGRVNLFDTVRPEIKYRSGSDDFSPSTIRNYNSLLKRLVKYHGDESLCYEDITVDWLKEYYTSLKDEGLSANYINAVFKRIRTFVNIGITKEVITYYPFDAFTLPKPEKTEKEKLSLQELAAFEKLLPKLNDVQKQAVTYFLFGCYSGLRVSDWRRFNHDTHVTNEGIQIMTKKTKTWAYVPFPNGMLEYMLELTKALPLTITDVEINNQIKAIAKQLGINKHLTSHCARKTFAVTICSDNKISCEVCASMMGITVQVCMENYYRVNKARVKKEATEAWAKKLKRRRK